MASADVAQRLGAHPTEILLVLSLLAVASLWAAPRLMGWLFRRLQAPLRRAGKAFLHSGVGQKARGMWPHLFDEDHQDREARLFLLLYLMIILACLLASGWLFGAIALQVFSNPEVQRFDAAFAESLRRHVHPLEVVFFRLVTVLCGVTANWLWGLVVTLFLVKRREWSLLVVWLVGLLGSGVLISHLKAAFLRQRPVLQQPLAFESSHSFPSGHSVSSIVMYGLLCYIVVLTVPRVAVRPAILFTALLGVSVGLSRLVLGVHYLSDVLAGWAVGGAWLALLLAGAEYRRRRALLVRGQSDLSVENPPEVP